MRNLLIAAAAGLMSFSALPSAAATAPQERPYMQGPVRGPDMRGPDRRIDPPGRNDARYGRWDNGWGARPPAPPRHWTRHSDWYRHVRACSQRYRSYDPRTDTFVVRRGVVQRCRL